MPRQSARVSKSTCVSVNCVSIDSKKPINTPDMYNYYYIPETTN